MKIKKITQMSFAKVYPSVYCQSRTEKSDKRRSRSDYYLADWV